MRRHRDPRMEKLVEFRRHGRQFIYYHTFNPGLRAFFNNHRERSLRQLWRRYRWHDYERVDFSRFTHRHSALWDIT